MIRIGDIQVDGVLDGMMGVAPAVLYPQVADWTAERDHLDAAGLVPLPYGGFLVRGPDGRVVLVDIGGGRTFAVPEVAGRLYSSGQLFDGLGQLGVTPSDVTDVVFTHLHFDHCGWSSTEDGHATFPSATYWCHEADWRAFVVGAADERVRSAMAPVVASVRTWSAERALMPWLRLMPCPGHTPGNAVVLVESAGERLALIGDLVHHPLEFAHFDWHGGVDFDPPGAVTQRAAWLARFADEGIPVVGPHFPDQHPVTVHRDGRGIGYVPSTGTT
jgi:glyoxylase-like metal-dependent hydrolase (beta-lactamase superfamily II)